MDLFSKYHCVVFTEIHTSLNDVIQWNNQLRAQKKVTILTQCLGLYGYIFSDFGDEHMVIDSDGERTQNFIVSDVEKSVNAEDPSKSHLIVFVHEDKRHTFHDDSFVKFREIQGMTELNESEPLKIEVINGYSFRIRVDPSKFSDYLGGGIVEDVKVPLPHKFNSLQQCISKPLETNRDKSFYVYDFADFERPGQLHIAFQAIQGFKIQKGRWPGDNQEDTDEVLKIAEFVNAKLGEEEGTFKLDAITDQVKTVISNASRFSQSCISPMAAFFGGIAAQEVVKVTGKYTPVTQFFHFDQFLCLPRTEVDRSVKGSRYDDQIRIFGNEMQQKLGDLHIFMVGAGALGCEFVKSYAMMGIGCGSGKVTCTDNDNIEVSNLNRQFLFRQGNVGTPKSRTALEIGATMNSSLRNSALTEYVSPDTENIFNDAFWDSVSFVVNAVDNVKARQYVD